MVKMLQKRMTVILIVSMLLQVFVSATSVLAEDLGGHTTESGFVPMLAVTLSPGETMGAAAVTVTDYVYGALFVNVTEREIAMPRIGDTAPLAGDNLITDYESGADITVAVEAGNYLQVYDVDMTDEARIVAFYQVELTAEDIRQGVAEEPILDLEEESDIKSDEKLEEGQELDEDLSGDLKESIEERFENQLPNVGLAAEEGYTYIDENGQLKYTGDKTVSKITFSAGTLVLNSGWYIVEGNVDRYWSIAVNGDVHLILADNSSLDIEGFFDAGINVSEGNSLTIYAQSTGDEMGVLNAMGHFYAAGIGGKEGNGGNITINGGTVIAKGGSSIGTGIGGGLKGSGGEVTINGGKVTAIGGTGCAGIGGSSYSHGGIVTMKVMIPLPIE